MSITFGIAATLFSACAAIYCWRAAVYFKKKENHAAAAFQYFLVVVNLMCVAANLLTIILRS